MSLHYDFITVRTREERQPADEEGVVSLRAYQTKVIGIIVNLTTIAYTQLHPSCKTVPKL